MTAVTWLACCGPKHNHLWFVFYASEGRNAWIASNGQRVAWAQNVYPSERPTHIPALRKEGVLLGEFPTYEEAFAAACAELNREQAPPQLPLPSTPPTPRPTKLRPRPVPAVI